MRHKSLILWMTPAFLLVGMPAAYGQTLVDYLITDPIGTAICIGPQIDPAEPVPPE